MTPSALFAEENRDGKTEDDGDGGREALYAGVVRSAGICEAGGGVCGPEAERNGNGDQPAFRAGGSKERKTE